MINKALSGITQDLNEYLKKQLSLQEDKAILSSIVNQDGSVANHTQNKLVITLVNIEEDRVSKNMPPINPAINPHLSINMNLNMLVSANFGSDNYPESLSFLSQAISFFQDKPIFTRQNTPALDTSIEKMVMELQPTTYENMNNIWRMLGAHYMPCVLYKLRIQ